MDKMKTKPFNLEEALRVGKAVTRDGNPVFNLHLNHNGRVVFGLIGKTTHSWDRFGSYNFGGVEHNFDLLCLSESPEKEEPEMYVNFYSDTGLGRIYYDLNEALENNCLDNYRHTYRLTKVEPNKT